jgi:hypothetical protein
LRFATLVLLLGLSLWDAAAAQTTNSVVKQIAPGIFQIGRVRLDKQSRSIAFPAVVNMTEAAIEYAIVTKYGKTHESLLRTDAEPKDIHVAMLLLGAKGASNAVPEDPLKPIPGEPVIIELSWRDQGREKRLAIEELVWNVQTKTNLSKGPWIYNGSRVVNGIFTGEQEGSIVSLITDGDALVNNPRAGRDNDELCEVNSKRVPPLDTPMEVRFILQQKK